MPVTSEHQQRLVAAGVDPEVLGQLALHEVSTGLSRQWYERGNALYIVDGVEVSPNIVAALDAYAPQDAVVVLATFLIDRVGLYVDGSGPTVYVGPAVYVQAGEIFCGAESSIVLNGIVSATGRLILDARNGGSVVADVDQLWAGNVYIATDDMHRLEDLETGVRLNPFGGHITIGEHVWLGRDVVVTGDVELGDGCVVGMGSYVRSQKVAANTAVAGTPARVIREGVAWRQEDTP